MIEFELPIRTVSEANLRGSWRKHAARRKQQRAATALMMRPYLHDLPKKPWTITLTRIAPRMLDSDNAVGALKHVRDGIADATSIDDGDPAHRWVYGDQQKRPKREGDPSVLIRIAATDQEAVLIGGGG